MKNNFCLFEKPSKIQKNGVFLFEISFFVLEIFTFLSYANEESSAAGLPEETEKIYTLITIDRKKATYSSTKP